MESAKQKASEEYAGQKAEAKSSREAMLKAIQQNQPAFIEAPAVPIFAPSFTDAFQKYCDVLQAIGGQVYTVHSYEEIIRQLQDDFAGVKRMVSFESVFSAIAETVDAATDPHRFEDVDVLILSSPLAVAENGAIWISDQEMPVRVLPFIAQSLVAVIHKKDIVATMHDAYDIIAGKDYGFATFIAGPSKTADIEQSLVLGAHGPKTMTVFILDKSE